MFSATQSQTLVNFVVITKKLFYFYMIASVLDHTVTSPINATRDNDFIAAKYVKNYQLIS